jgi:hypothetical protein
MKKYMLIGLLSLFIIIGCDEKAPPKIDMTKFLPAEKITKYIYESTEEGIYSDDIPDMIMEKIVTSRKNNCVYMDNYTLTKIKNVPKRLKAENEIFCVKKDMIEISNSLTIKQENNTWDIKMHRFTNNCKFISLSKEKILNKNRDVIHIECKYKLFADTNMVADWFLAENIGWYKLIQTSDLGGPNNKDVSNLILIKYE